VKGNWNCYPKFPILIQRDKAHALNYTIDLKLFMYSSIVNATFTYNLKSKSENAVKSVVHNENANQRVGSGNN